MDYVHFNPLKHRYVTDVADWPHATFKACVRRGLYPESWLGPRTTPLQPKTPANDAYGGSRFALDPPYDN